MLKLQSNDKVVAGTKLGNTQCCPPSDELLNIFGASKVTILCSVNLYILAFNLCY
jgi:hypothetical protein